MQHDDDDYSWCENYFVDRDERDRLHRVEEEESTIPITLPIKQPRCRSGGQRSLTHDIIRGQRSQTLGYRSRSPPITRYFCKTLGRWIMMTTESKKLITACAQRRLLDVLKYVVPEMDLRSDEWSSAYRMVQEVSREDTIHFAMYYIAMDDDTRMIQAYAECERRSPTPPRKIYVGITENPVRRLQMHLELYGNVINMLIVRVRLTSAETAYWETNAIRRFREELGYASLLNRGDGGERASAGRPHYGYILTMH